MSTASAASPGSSRVGESWALEVEAPSSLARFLAVKGSVAVDGVSLTVNRVEDRASGCAFAINLIPHTVQNTSLRGLAVGAAVNLEIDLIARYVERMLGMTSRAGLTSTPPPTISPWPSPPFPSSSPSWPPAAW